MHIYVSLIGRLAHLTYPWKVGMYLFTRGELADVLPQEESSHPSIKENLAHGPQQEKT